MDSKETPAGTIRTRIVAVEIQDNGYVRDTNKGIMIGYLSYEGPSALEYFDSIANLTALDSLAVEPSEDVRQLTNEIIDCCVSYWRTRNQAIGLSIWEKAAALIQARDERIRKECAGEIALLRKQRKELYNWRHPGNYWRRLAPRRLDHCWRLSVPGYFRRW